MGNIPNKGDDVNNTADVGVIGAGGCSGLAILKALAELDLRSVLGLEAAMEVGGIYSQPWLPSRFRLQTPKNYSKLFHNLNYDSTCGVYPQKSDVNAYLNKAVGQFTLSRFIRFGQRVIRTKFDAKALYPWQVICSNAQGESQIYHFKYLVVASGRFSKPRWPALMPTAQQFPNDVIKFCTDYRDTDNYANKRVLVVGLGNSGQDIVLDLLRQGASVSVSQRGPINIGPDFMLRIGNKQFLTGFMFARFLQPFCQYGGRIGRLAADVIARSILRLYYPHHNQYGIKWDPVGPFSKNAAGLESRIPIVDEGIMAAIKQGALSKILPSIERYHDHQQVEFSDGSFKQFDEIIYCTGFMPALDYLPEVVRERCLSEGIPKFSGVLDSHYALGFMGMHFDLFGGIGRILPRNARSLAHAIKKAVQSQEHNHHLKLIFKPGVSVIDEVKRV
jgi:cation diffusion facilitator CzcD-associated flavoprotein CzcO